ncbi:uncharacterized protein LOC114713205 [Neltuma alba]|uniref:uncharacterized protein LOC114713205 n=1 Tax=Neltuma alba TaxID=207710 RepID=UPI0010A53288|nr:uncharacterized protein LOC114713205 [Prosopis alba]XP_028753623.1 uncharacterized protein LOC114713205 [Prosopis alba]XP_028753624.1 uncharacterized protein LOC114713205 [Prosopis alba]XP_028753625.1 uncharacterized protein LOC114713205 [Prosopis alba]XP_028753626.1 uncharacterized protein LOC114713205 [Prosopis alba]XP_028753627.1 uncharacterized protein LOC114713205 [Prosopis alba]XP_028753628.1 uncharacterized protein LOC114713205 [Prosopis alba]
MMALLGMGANVQCNGTKPGYHSSRDLIFGPEGSTRTSSNNNFEIQNGVFINGSLPIEYNKELVKQTILKHEVMFKEQIHELHRLYNRQKELMDEVKRNFDKHLSLGISWSSSNPSHVSSKTPNLPWSTGQSSAIVVENIQMSLDSGKGNSRQIHSASALFPAEGCSKDFRVSHLENRKVGNKFLDLHLPADEYIDSEKKAKSLENEMVSKFPRVSAYTLEGVSQAVCNSDKRPYGANLNGLSNLNEPFEHLKEATMKFDDPMGPASHKKGPFHDLSTRGEPCFHNMSNDVFWNPYKRQDHEGRTDNQPSEKKNQEQLPYMIRADQINQRPWREREFSCGESSVGTTKGPMSASLLGPSSDPYQLVSGPDVISFRIPPQVLLKAPGSNTVENQTAVQALPHFGTSSLFDQRSKPLTGLPGPTGDELYTSENIKSGVNLDCQNFLQSSFFGGSKTSDAPSFLTNHLNSFANQSSPTSHELRKHVKDSEDVETSNNINLNVVPANNSETAAFQNVKEDLLPEGKPCGENKISVQTESFLLKPCDSGITRGFELMTTGARDCSGRKIHASNTKGEPETSSDQYSFRASPSRVCQNQTKNEKIEETQKGCVPDIELPRNHVPGLGDQITTGENLTKNEEGRELKCGAGIIDLNISMNEDENLPVDIDFQAPVSPENKESSPPRGESDENQLEISYQLAGQECSELQPEEARLAAEALISISESVAHNGLQMITCPPLGSLTSSPLHWFARIATSVTDHPGNSIKADFIGNTSDHEEFLSAGIDYFEAMTLKLTETKSLDCFGKSSGQKGEEGGSTSPTQPRKGWASKGKRQKDFQSEILPSLTSLSRYEVTEDLQTIGGLMEAAGAHSERVSLRGAGRNALARGRRRSSASVPNNTDSLKQQPNSGVKLGIEKRGLMSWGRANRKPRGKRCPARNPQFFWSQVSYNRI